MKPAEHGTATSYRKGCRCDVCKEAQSVRAKEAYRRKKSLAPKKHNASTYKQYGCRCDVCKRANSEEKRTHRRSRRSKKPSKHNYVTYTEYGCRCQECCEDFEAHRPDTVLRKQEATKSEARRNGYEWTGPELEILCRDDLTAKEKAFMTGRTYYAVAQQIHLMNIGDRGKLNLAGVRNLPEVLKP
ncbi:hypothetical protein ABZ215_33505 [Amycolatopsis sp. NPDC006131]|uniref:hypothetical protein n=1 Tax=Amycolatopsis sp. NPDC006131 TaxID=3156731 RepID=UPI0033A5A302